MAEIELVATWVEYPCMVVVTAREQELINEYFQEAVKKLEGMAFAALMGQKVLDVPGDPE